VNAYPVPYCFARFGVLSKEISETKITAMYIEAVKASLDPSTGTQLNQLISQKKTGFAVIRNPFGVAFSNYQYTARTFAREFMHITFFVSRDAPRDLIKEDILKRMDTIHEFLGLENGQALMGRGHPLVTEYGQLPEDYHLRFFPADGKNGETIANTTSGSAFLQFIEALGNALEVYHDSIFRRLASKINIVASKDIDVLTGCIERWRLRRDSSRGIAADTPGDNLSKAPYFVLQAGGPDASPLINLLCAGLFDLIICRIT
jgi:hypothetical protein